MVRLRENAENVAFYGGEAREFDTFQTRFARIVANWWGIIKRRKKLTWFTTGYYQLAIIFPFVVAAPRYFDKAIQLGGLMQISSAFGQVQESLSFIISSYTEIAEYQSVVQRLAGFREQDGRDRGGAAARRSRSKSNATAPASRSTRSISICRTASRCGRTSRSRRAPGEAAADHRRFRARARARLLRAIAGLWPFGRGRIRVGDGRCLFLPQRPYLPLGTLADALVYPRAAAELSRDSLADGAARRRPARARRPARRGG